MGVWIETLLAPDVPIAEKVTPYVGVWIETLQTPSDDSYNTVTPYVGVWIETINYYRPSIRHGSHTLRGCVD